MLILSRRESECVCLGDNIVLTIVAVGNDKIRIGVQAPPGIRILRSELDAAILPFNPPPAAQATLTGKVIEAAPLRAMVAKSSAIKQGQPRRAA